MDIKCTSFQLDNKNYIYIDDTAIYYRNLENTFRHILGNGKVEFLNFAFVALCSSTLEASLNHIIVSYFINEFGPIDYKRYSDSFINLSFTNKLHSVPILVTKSEFYFNPNSKTIKILEELITLRNRLLHQKPILQEFEHDIDELEIGVPIVLKMNDYIASIKKSQCINFNREILTFKAEFMDSYFDKSLKESIFLKKK